MSNPNPKPRRKGDSLGKKDDDLRAGTEKIAEGYLETRGDYNKARRLTDEHGRRKDRTTREVVAEVGGEEVKITVGVERDPRKLADCYNKHRRLKRAERDMMGNIPAIGRPRTFFYTEEELQLAEKMARAGITQQKIREVVWPDMSFETYKNWKRKFPEFRERIDAARGGEGYHRPDYVEMTEEVCLRVCDAIIDLDGDLKKVCSIPGMPDYNTFVEWRKKNLWLQIWVNDARTRGKYRWLLKAGVPYGDNKAAWKFWQMERCYYPDGTLREEPLPFPPGFEECPDE